jgi:hypothetical protein
MFNLIKNHTMKTYRREGVFLNLSLAGGEWSASTFSCFTGGKRCQHLLAMMLAGVQSWSRLDSKDKNPTKIQIMVTQQGLPTTDTDVLSSFYNKLPLFDNQKSLILTFRLLATDKKALQV